MRYRAGVQPLPATVRMSGMANHDGLSRDDPSPADDAPEHAAPPAGVRQVDDVPEAVDEGQPSARSMVVRFLGIAGFALALFAVTYLGLVTTEVGQRVENLALRGAELRSEADRDAALGRLSVVTVAIFGISLVAVLAVGFLRRRERLAFIVAGAMGGSVVIAEILKSIIERPALVEGPIWLLRNSFPSGSAAVAASIAVGSLLVAPDRLRWIVLPLAVGFAALIGEAVQTAGWHRLSDTLGGVLIVITVASAGLAVLAWDGHVTPSRDARIDRRMRTALLSGGAVAIGIAAILIVLPAIFPLLGEPDGARRSIFQTAFPLLGVGTTTIAIVAFSRAIDGVSLGRRA